MKQLRSFVYSLNETTSESASFSTFQVEFSELETQYLVEYFVLFILNFNFNLFAYFHNYKILIFQ